MNQKESMMLHIRLDPETHRQVKHICVDLSISMQDYIYNLVKNGNFLYDAVKKKKSEENK